MRRLLFLLALVVTVAVTAAAAAASGHSASPPSVPATNGFAGPVSSAPRAIDRDLESSSSAGLRRIPCPTGGGTTCWVAAP